MGKNYTNEFIKRILVDNHEENSPFLIKEINSILSYHDAIHITVACMEPIFISDGQKENYITGVSGITIKEFSSMNNNSFPEYDGMIDESRVAFEHFLIDKNPLNTMRVAAYCSRLISKNIDPVDFFTKHLQARGKPLVMPKNIEFSSSDTLSSFKGMERLIALKMYSDMENNS